jgi:hypothetical protein
VVEHRLGNLRVERQVAEHGGHVRLDHAGALADAGHRDQVLADHHFARGRFRLRVGGHDRFGRVEPVVRLEVGNGGRQAGDDLLDRQGFEDHASRKRQHLLRRAAQQLRQRGARGLRIREPRLAGAGVGVAGIDDQRADRRAAGRDGGQVGFADLHRCGAEAVQREYAGDGGALLQFHDQHVLAAGLLDAGFGIADFNAVDGVEQSCDGQRGIDGHGGIQRKNARASLYRFAPAAALQAGAAAATWRKDERLSVRPVPRVHNRGSTTTKRHR